MAIKASDLPFQRSLDDLGEALRDVTFCVIDLETTGGNASTCGITEIGAVKYKGGECLGTFQTLVNPGCAIPPEITVLTGITQSMVIPAPRIESVLPTLLEFIGNAVIVGHNIRFDLSFLNAALERSGRERLANATVDTVPLARRLVRDEVPNCKLSTLAERLRLGHRPTHRALDDAITTGELLHVLIERAAGLGVTGLDDLTALPSMSGHAQAAKLRLTEHLPRVAGVYLFKNSVGDVLYVGKATNLRSRVRSYFSTDSRRKIGPMLRETAHIDFVVHPNPLAAAVHEIRLIHQHQPPYNRQAKTWGRYVYVKLTLQEQWPRLSIVKDPKLDGALYIGPVHSRSTAQKIVEAIHSSVPLRRCVGRISTRSLRDAPCTAAQLGVSMCPCAGGVDPDEYAAIVNRAVKGITEDPSILCEPLQQRMIELACDERFEEAADVRDRADALTRTLYRQRRNDQLRRAGRLRVDLPDGSGVIILNGELQSAWDRNGEIENGQGWLEELFHLPPSSFFEPIARDISDEVNCIAAWLEKYAEIVSIHHCEGGLATQLPPLPTFTPRASNV